MGNPRFTRHIEFALTHDLIKSEYDPEHPTWPYPSTADAFRMSRSTHCVTIRTAHSTYPIQIGCEAIRLLGDLIRSSANPHGVHLIVDRRVWELHANSVLSALGGANVNHGLTLIAGGEGSKGLAVLSDVLNDL